MATKGSAGKRSDGAGVKTDRIDPSTTEDGVFLSWAGRKNFRAAVPTPRVFVPVPEASDPRPEDPGNLVIEGDNRQAMVSLFAQYQNQVDAVLIDVPYNTGKNDFRYDDARFQDPDADHAKGDFVKAEDGGKHTKWLNQMATTLWLIKELMAQHAVIFVHINDIELPRLLLLMEEIFDSNNWLGTIVWKNATDNNPSQIVIEHEYIVCFAKDKGSVPAVWKSPAADTLELMQARFEEMKGEGLSDIALEKAWKQFVTRHRDEVGEFAHYNRVDDHGPYTGMRALHNPGKEGYRYKIPHPNGKSVVEPMRGYRYPEWRMKELIAEGKIIFAADETQLVQLKVYLEDADVSLRGVISLDSRTAANEIAALFPGEPNVFRNPKPVSIEEYLLSFVTSKDALILDCFAGSGTTGHAVMRLNKKDGGSRRFILIEEGNPGDHYATTLTAERLRRARTQERLPGGFSFIRLGEQIDREAFAAFQRHTVVEAIRQADASGRGVGIKPIDGKWVIGANSRRQAICFGYSVDGEAVTAADLHEMFLEADSLALVRPLRVYGSACEVLESDGFAFFQIPEELLANLSVGRGLRG